MKDFETKIKEIKDEILSEIKQVATKNSAVAIEPYFISEQNAIDSVEIVRKTICLKAKETVLLSGEELYTLSCDTLLDLLKLMKREQVPTFTTELTQEQKNAYDEFKKSVNKLKELKVGMILDMTNDRTYFINAQKLNSIFVSDYEEKSGIDITKEVLDAPSVECFNLASFWSCDGEVLMATLI